MRSYSGTGSSADSQQGRVNENTALHPGASPGMVGISDAKKRQLRAAVFYIHYSDKDRIRTTLQISLLCSLMVSLDIEEEF